MRIAVIGDFHIQPQELSVTEAAMEDLATSRPDLVVPLGDFGSNEVIGSTEGLYQAYRYLREIGAPMRPILGNHDLQRESGPGLQPKGTMERAFLDLYGLDSAYGVLELEHVRLFFISTEPQPPESCYQIQECYATDSQFKWLQKALKKRPGVPCIVFSHAPPIGCGLRTVPQVHVRATNAYLDQNHDPNRWLELFRSTPEIVVWLSAHYHLGHGHPDSSTERYGTRFFITGVHANVTRDGQRQSRMIELENDRLSIYTVDHVLRKQVSEADWNGGDLRKLVERKRNLLRVPESALHGCKQDWAPRRVYSCTVGGASSFLRKVLPLSDSRCLVTVDDGYLWEADFKAEAVLGSLHLGEPLAEAAVSEDGIWRAWGGTLARSNPYRLERFQRDVTKAKEELTFRFDETITALAARQGGGVYVSCGQELYEVAPEDDGNDTAYCIRFVHNTLNETRIVRLNRQDHALWWITEDRKLWSWDLINEAMLVHERTIAWDGLREEEAGIQSSLGGGLQAYFKSAKGNWKQELPPTSSDADIACLGEETALLLYEGKAWLWQADFARLSVLETGAGRVTAISRMDTGVFGTFCLTVSATELLPQLQVWNFTSKF